MSRYSKPDKIKIPQSLGAFLIDRRVERGLSISEFARLAEIDHAHMSRILSGLVGMTAEVAIKMERALGITALRLMTIQVKHDLAKARHNKSVSKLREAAGYGSLATKPVSGSSEQEWYID